MARHPQASAIYTEIGVRVREARTKARLTQAELAAALGQGTMVNRTTINNLEKGRQFVPLPLLYDIANVFQLSISELLPPREWAETASTQASGNRKSTLRTPPSLSQVQSALMLVGAQVPGTGGPNAKS